MNELEDKELECERRSDNVIKRIDRLKEDRALIASFNNTVDEKMDALQDNAECIKEYEEELEDERRALYTIVALIDIIENIRFDKEWNKDVYIYGGIEVGDNITAEDVIE